MAFWQVLKLKVIGKGYCTCWIDGWWGSACKRHDEMYMHPHIPKVSKLQADLLLWYNVIKADLRLFPLGVVIGLVMFVGVSIGGYHYWERHRKEREDDS